MLKKILTCDLERKWLKCSLDSVVFINFLGIYELQHSRSCISENLLLKRLHLST